jgi:hypothetical protein
MLKPTGGESVTTSSTPAEILIRSFSVGDHVYVLDVRPTATHKWIPGTVSQVLGDVHYMVNVNGTLWKRHIDQIRPNFAPELQYGSSANDSLFEEDDGVNEDDTVLHPTELSAADHGGHSSMLSPAAEDYPSDHEEDLHDAPDVEIETPPPTNGALRRNTVPSQQPPATASVPTNARRSGRTRTAPTHLKDFVPTIDFRQS